MAFIDYEKALDSVSTTAVPEASRDQGIQGTYTRLLIHKGCMGNTSKVTNSQSKRAYV